MSFDGEKFFTEIVDLFKDKFNCYIGGLNNLKKKEGTDFEINEVNDYVLFDITTIGDCSLFVSYEFIEQEPNDETTSAKSIKYTMQFLVNMVDDSTSQNELALKHLLRYQRAMIQMINANFDKYSGNDSIRIEGIPPAVYQLDDTNEYIWRNCGINISMVINYD